MPVVFKIHFRLPVWAATVGIHLCIKLVPYHAIYNEMPLPAHFSYNRRFLI